MGRFMAKPASDEGLYRFERKFVIPGRAPEEVEWIVRCHPALFSEIYQERAVNNVYWDTPGFHFYRDSVEGACERVKIRIRWYGDLLGEIAGPSLELKFKRGTLGRKVTCRLEPFVLSQASPAGIFRTALQRSELTEAMRTKLELLSPVLANRYWRKYFQSRDGRFRITLDSRLEYFSVGVGGRLLSGIPAGDSPVILELKYAAGQDLEAEVVTQHFPFRMEKSSKYTAGAEILEPHLW